MLLTWGLGAVGGLIAGPPGALALGGIGAQIEGARAIKNAVERNRAARQAEVDEAERIRHELGADMHEPKWNAHLGIWETPYNAYFRKK